MALDLGTLYYTVEARTTQLRQAYSRVRDFSSRASSSFGRVAQSVTSLQGSIAILAGGAGLGMLAKSFVDVTSKAEDLQIALDTITKGKGEETFKRLNQWALRMPINTEKAIDSFKQLRAMGLQPTIKDMTTLVDASSALGGGTQTFQGIARALGQIATKGKVSAEELMQLAERGVPAYQILQKRLDLTAEQVRNIGSSGIDASKALRSLMAGLEERFGGASKRIMNAWSGMIESLRSWAKEFARFVMKSGPFQAMKSGLKEFLDYLETNKGQMALKKWASDTAKGVLTAFEMMISGVKKLIKTLHWVKRAVKGVQIVAQSLRYIFTASIDSINTAFIKMINYLTEKTNAFIEQMNNIPGVAVDKLAKVAKNSLGKWFERQAEQSAQAISKLKGELNSLANEDPVPKSWSDTFDKLRDKIDEAKKATDRFTGSAKKGKQAGIDFGAGIGKAGEESDKAAKRIKEASKALNKMDESAKKAEHSGAQAGDSIASGMNKVAQSAGRAAVKVDQLGRKYQEIGSGMGGATGAQANAMFRYATRDDFSTPTKSYPVPRQGKERKLYYMHERMTGEHLPLQELLKFRKRPGMSPFEYMAGPGGVDPNRLMEQGYQPPRDSDYYGRDGGGGNQININMQNNGVNDPTSLADQLENELIQRMKSGRMREAIQDAAAGR